MTARNMLALLGLAAVATTNAFTPTASRLARSAVISRLPDARATSRERRPVQPIARTFPHMAEDGGDVGGVFDELKRRGAQLARDLANAAEAAKDMLDDGLDAVLGPAPSPSPGLIPIPIPVDDYPPYGRSRGYDDYPRY